MKLCILQEEVFDDGVLRPSTMEPTKTCLKRTTSPPATSSRYNTIFESADLESRDVWLMNIIWCLNLVLLP